MTDIEGFLTIYGHSDNLLNNKVGYMRGTAQIGCHFMFTVCLFVSVAEIHCKVNGIPTKSKYKRVAEFW